MNRNKKSKRITIVLIVSILFILSLICLFSSPSSDTDCNKGGEIVDRSGWQVTDDIFWQMWNDGTVDFSHYANKMRFHSHFVKDNGSWVLLPQFIDREIILVRNSDEAALHGLPYDKIIAWPSAYSLGMMDAINQGDFNLGDFNLTHPLTIDDLIYNWRDVYFLLRDGMNIRTLNGLYEHAREYSEGKEEPWIITYLLFPGRLDALNVMLANHDMANIDFEWISRNKRAPVTLEDIPSLPFTEQDVRNDPYLISLIASNLLTREERRSIEPEAIIRRLHEQNMSIKK